MNEHFSMKRRFAALAMALAAATTLGVLSDRAEAIPAGWTCVGTCGTIGASGVVTLPPVPLGATTYDYIVTKGSGPSNGASLGLGSETDGTFLKSNAFSAGVGDKLEFAFDFVTSDGAGFADYAWARLRDLNTDALTYLVTARTKPSGSIIPGFGMPAIAATLNPPSVPIIGGGPVWAPLGGSSGACFSAGCGYTGWVLSDYMFTTADNYQLEFGTVNWLDNAFQTGLAISGAAINDVPITTAPEPGSIALLGVALLGAFVARRRRAA